MDRYIVRWARATRDGAWTRLGTGLGCGSLVVLPLVGAAVAYAYGVVRFPDAGLANVDALIAAGLGAVVTAVVWAILLLGFSALSAPAEMDAELRAANHKATRALEERAASAESRLESVLTDLSGMVTIAEAGAHVGHPPGSPKCSVNLGIIVRNSAQVPLRYEMRELHASVSDAEAPGPLPNRTGYIPPYNGIASYYANAIGDVPWSFPIIGEIRFELAYGAHARPLEFTFRGRLRVAIAPSLREGEFVVQWNWISEPKFGRDVKERERS